MKLAFLTLLLVSLLIILTSTKAAAFSSKVGICYGQLGNNLPTPTQSVNLIKTKLKAKRVKLYDANPNILKALKNTNIQVTIMVPNELIKNISSNQTLSDSWIQQNVMPFYPQTLIRYILVGNEILSNPNLDTWFNLVPAMRRIRYSLKTHNLKKLKVGTTMAMDVLETSFPPSNGTFRKDISAPVMKPVLSFLNKTKSFFFLDVYPYFAWVQDSKKIHLDYALLESDTVKYVDPVTRLTYTNLFDQMVDSVFFAMEKLGFKDVRVWIAETGWPNGGDYDQIGCNIRNAAVYNRNVVKRLTAKPAIGTPARPGKILPSYLFALYNENQKGGPGTERHFGLLYPNMTGVFDIDLTGKLPEKGYKPLPVPENNELYKGKIWCVVAEGANVTEVAGALQWACTQGNSTCEAIKPRGKCYKRGLSLIRQASYAFSAYWAQSRKLGGSCYFNGLATQTVEDPSYGSCKIPSVTL